MFVGVLGVAETNEAQLVSTQRTMEVEKKKEKKNAKDGILKVLTGGGSVQRAKHVRQKPISLAILSGVSKHCDGSFPTVE